MPKIKEIIEFKLEVEVGCGEDTDPEVYEEFKAIISTRIHYAIHQQQGLMTAKLLSLDEQRTEKKNDIKV